jgi:hypothetical protein
VNLIELVELIVCVEENDLETLIPVTLPVPLIDVW